MHALWITAGISPHVTEAHPTTQCLRADQVKSRSGQKETAILHSLGCCNTVSSKEKRSLSVPRLL